MMEIIGMIKIMTDKEIENCQKMVGVLSDLKNEFQIPEKLKKSLEKIGEEFKKIQNLHKNTEFDRPLHTGPELYTPMLDRTDEVIEQLKNINRNTIKENLNEPKVKETIVSGFIDHG